MKCKHCQNEIIEESNFCPSCGKALNENIKSKTVYLEIDKVNNIIPSKSNFIKIGQFIKFNLWVIHLIYVIFLVWIVKHRLENFGKSFFVMLVIIYLLGIIFGGSETKVNNKIRGKLKEIFFSEQLVDFFSKINIKEMSLSNSFEQFKKNKVESSLDTTLKKQSVIDSKTALFIPGKRKMPVFRILIVIVIIVGIYTPSFVSMNQFSSLGINYNASIYDILHKTSVTLGNIRGYVSYLDSSMAQKIKLIQILILSYLYIPIIILFLLLINSKGSIILFNILSCLECILTFLFLTINFGELGIPMDVVGDVLSFGDILGSDTTVLSIIVVVGPFILGIASIFSILYSSANLIQNKHA